MKNKPRVFSGIKPTGNLHIGNYIGAIKQWVDMQNNYECIFCIVDLHAITVPQDPKILREKTRELAALYLACGIDPEKSTVFVQSHNSDHPVLAWILDCIASMGQLERMTQYKSKAKDMKGTVSVGLFNYPALMAADILLYQTDEVPVGDDQKQHVELTRDLAERFNSRFGKVFKVPEVRILKIGARVTSLQSPNKKMSKSDKDKNGTIDLLDSPDEIRRKIAIAVTDSGKEVVFRQDKPGISNLLTIYSQLSGQPIAELEKKYQGKSYQKFKEDLTEVVVESLKPIQERYQQMRKEVGLLNEIFRSGLEKVKPISEETLKEVYRVMGLG
jgi:tryptophanyl-tRNA synthetase